MAPEQVRGDRITPACDVFCLGSVLAYAATGSLPFGSADSGAHALMFRIAQEEPDLSGVPEGIADLVRDCLRKDPAGRPSLDAILERTGVEDTVVGGRSRDPWLPSSLVAQLGRHAVQLLEVENPERGTGTGTGSGGAPGAGAAAAGAGVSGGDASGAAGVPWARAGGGSPEHAPVSDGGPSAGVPAGGVPSAGVPAPGGPAAPVDHLPTVVSAQAPPPPSAPPPGAPPAPAGFGAAYGTAQPHPQQPHQHPAAYGYP